MELTKETIKESIGEAMASIRREIAEASEYNTEKPTDYDLGREDAYKHALEIIESASRRLGL